ncbi:MAG: DNA translocase FtsK [Clostridia bacterium]|nr:DNA translocase FtsK [Clostridia bacterium]
MADKKKKVTKKDTKTAKNEKKPAKSQPKVETVEKNEVEYKPSAVLPYVLILISVILAICFVTIKVFEVDGGAGPFGDFVMSFLSGILGSAMYLLPITLFYIGVNKLIYSLRWFGGSKRKPTAEHNPATDRKHVNLVVTMSLLCIFFVSVLFGVINYDYSGFDIATIWSDSAENVDGVVGGIIGGSVGTLLAMFCEKLIPIILLVFGIIATFLSAVGLTPIRIIAMVQERRAAREELFAREEEEAERLEEEEQENGQKQLKVKTVKPEAKLKNNVVAQDTPEQEDENEEENDEENAEYKPLTSPVSVSTSQGTSGVYIGINGNIETIKENTQKVEEEPENVDFGGDPTFDTKEYKDVQGVMDALKLPVTPVKNEEPESEEPKVDENKEETKKENSLELKEMENDELLSEYSEVAPEEGEEEVEIETPYVFPPIDLLAENPGPKNEDFSAELSENANNLLRTLDSFKVKIDDISYSRGPTITRYELKPSAGTRVRTIANLVDDIALSLATTGVRIEAPIPNKPAVGIEVPNRTPETVYLRDLVNSPKFFESKSRLTSCLGKDVGGNPIYFDIAKMPHLLIAGATGMGKSVCINTIIVSLLYKARPDELKLILIDPKKVEFTMYKNVPHLYAPIVNDPKKAAGALASAVAEMERRFEIIEQANVRDITGYNSTIEFYPDREYMPHMVIIIDELADLMMTAPDDVETCICRLAQKARAAGIHIIIGTQRPSVDVITGLIKANIPSRIACTVASQTDSRTILDMAGAEKLIGRGDMLFAPVGASKPMRVQGAFVSSGEVEDIVSFIRDNNAAGKYNAEFIQMINEKSASINNGKKGSQGAMADMDAGGDDGEDPKFNEAVIIAIQEGKVATSFLQRKLGVGYGKAAKIIDAMEAKGYVSKADGNKPRRVLVTMEEYMRRKNSDSSDFGDDDDEM